MTCRACQFWSGQYTASGRVKRAAGRCGFPVELPALPAVIDAQRVRFAVIHRNAAWPDDGEGCATFKEREK